MVPPDHLPGCFPLLLHLLFHVVRPFNYPLSNKVSRLLPTLLALLCTHFQFYFILMILNLEKVLPPILSRLQMGGKGSLPQVPGLGAQDKGITVSLPEDDRFSFYPHIHSFVDSCSFTWIGMECSLSVWNSSRIKDAEASWNLLLAGETDYGKETNKHTIYF